MPLAMIALVLYMSSLAFALPRQRSDDPSMLTVRADNTTTTTTSTTPSSSPSPSAESSGQDGGSKGRTAGVIVAGICVVALFLAVFIIVMRHRRKNRRNKRNVIYDHPAVKSEMMRNYERQNRSNLIAARNASTVTGMSGGRNGRSMGSKSTGSGIGSVSTVGSWSNWGTGKKLTKPAPVATREEYRLATVDTPPPSYDEIAPARSTSK